MKQLFSCVLLTIALSTAVWNQSSAQDSISSKKAVLTLQCHGQTRDFLVLNYNISPEKTDTDTINSQTTRGILMVGLKNYTSFLLQAVEAILQML